MFSLILEDYVLLHAFSTDPCNSCLPVQSKKASVASNCQKFKVGKLLGSCLIFWPALSFSPWQPGSS